MTIDLLSVTHPILRGSEGLDFIGHNKSHYLRTSLFTNEKNKRKEQTKRTNEQTKTITRNQGVSANGVCGEDPESQSKTAPNC